MTPDPNNLSLGAGEVLFDRFDAAGESTGYRHLGNVESLTIATTVEKLEKKSSMKGARTTYKEVVIGQEAEVTMILSEFDPENLALAFRGDVADFTQAGAWGLSAQPINGGVAIVFDRWYPLGKRSLSNVVISQSGALTLGDDYEINLELGMVKILSTGSGTEAITTWAGDSAPLSSSKIRGLASSSINGRLKYFSAEDQVSGPRWEVDVHNFEPAPDGEMPLISEEFGTFTLKGKAQEDPTQPDGEEFFTQRELTAAEAGS
jgi:hypothetical protein